MCLHTDDYCARLFGKYKWCIKNEYKLNNHLKLDYTEAMIQPTPVMLQDKPHKKSPTLKDIKCHKRKTSRYMRVCYTILAYAVMNTKP